MVPLAARGAATGGEPGVEGTFFASTRMSLREVQVEHFGSDFKDRRDAMISPMGREDSCDLLKNRKLGRIGCDVEGIPYVVPVNYVFDGETVFVHSLPGRKITALRKNPNVCLQVDDIADNYHWRSVIVFGQFLEVNDEAERDEILAMMFRELPHLTPVESRTIKGQHDPIVFRITVDRISGVSEHWYGA